MMSLLEQFRSGRLDPSTLSGRSFQTLIFERLVEELFSNPAVLSIEDRPRGEIDYVVHEASTSGMLGTARFHYFECKNYSRSLELDNVAKVMVVAVADQPTSVHVVSRTPLQPQVAKYASRLFDIGESSNPIFRSVVFRHWQTDKLLNFVGSDLAYTTGASRAGDGEITWWMNECSAFYEEELSSTDNPRRDILIRRGALLHLIIEWETADAETVELDGFPDISFKIVPEVENPDVGTQQLMYVIDTAHFEARHPYRGSLRIRAGRREKRVPLVNLRVVASEAFLPELRLNEAGMFADEIGPRGHYRIALVGGEAGVGKTHLIERMAESLRASEFADVLCLSVTPENSGSLMKELLHCCLAPPIARTSFRELADAIQKALLPDEIGGRTVNVDISLLARTSVRIGRKVIVLRDCQHLTHSLANQLWSLIVALDDAGWGGVRMVLEFRTPDASANPAHSDLVKKIKTKMHSVFLEKSLLPLDEQAFRLAARALFTYATDDLVERLRRRTGGLPLFIETYVRRLERLGIINRNGAGGAMFSITQPARISADTVLPTGQLVLEDRIRSWLKDRFPQDIQDEVAADIGLVALAEDSNSRQLLRKALGLPAERLHAIQVGLSADGLGFGRPDGQILFRHDLFRAAFVQVAISGQAFAAKARAVADNLVAEIPGKSAVRVRSLRVKIFDALQDHSALETELRLGISLARQESDYGVLNLFLLRLMEIVKDGLNPKEKFELMSELAWTSWVSDSLVIARDRYRKLAQEADKCSDGDFGILDHIATDALRRAIGIDLELMEPVEFLRNTVAVLRRRQSSVTFNSILNRLVLFCARFGFPEHGYEFCKLSFAHIGDGRQENEGAVLYSEMGALFTAAEPETALDLSRRGLDLAADDNQAIYSRLDVMVIEVLHLGGDLDLAAFGAIWEVAQEKRLFENLARASLLRGSLLLRAGDLNNARHWIERTFTLVRLYHLKEFQIPVLNDHVLLCIMEGKRDVAARHLAELEKEFSQLLGQRCLLSDGIEQVLGMCRTTAATVPPKPSDLPRPSAPPTYCSPLHDMWLNIAAFAKELGLEEILARYTSPPAWHRSFAARKGGRYISLNGMDVVLGAY